MSVRCLQSVAFTIASVALHCPVAALPSELAQRAPVCVSTCSEHVVAFKPVLLQLPVLAAPSELVQFKRGCHLHLPRPSTHRHCDVPTFHWQGGGSLTSSIGWDAEKVQLAAGKVSAMLAPDKIFPVVCNDTETLVATPGVRADEFSVALCSTPGTMCSVASKVGPSIMWSVPAAASCCRLRCPNRPVFRQISSSLTHQPNRIKICFFVLNCSL